MSISDPYSNHLNDIGNPKDIPDIKNPANISYNYHISPNCKCGCGELQSRLSTLETAILELRELLEGKQDRPANRKYI